MTTSLRAGGTTRRLAAIVVVDVVGYSRLMAEDEAGTLATMTAHFAEIDPVLLNHGGRVVKRTGDGLLIEVPSAVEAIGAAVEAQRLMRERNASLPEERRMQLRIGINLGDVIVDETGDIFGDGVNVAARLEGLADPGGICVSASVHDQVRGRIAVDLESLGPVEVKNIPRPIEAWRVRLGGEASSRISLLPSRDLPTIAVLPFANLSADPDESYFSDGIVEDLITALSHSRELRVVARSSSFAMRDRNLDIRDAARELDATYIVNGSVRRAGNRVRVSSQLIEAETGHHVWADRFDRDLDDIFAVQDEIVGDIAGHIRPHMARQEATRRETATPEQLDEWDMVLRARHLNYRNTAEAAAEAIEMLEAGLAHAPGSAAIHANLAVVWVGVGFNRWNVAGRNPFEGMFIHGRAAYDADPHDPFAITMYAMAENFSGNAEHGEELGRRAVALAPHEALSHVVLGQSRFFRGDHDGAVEVLTEAWRIARHEPWRFHVATNMAFAHFLAGRHDAAVAWSERGLEAAEYLQLHAVAAAALGQLGRPDDAARHTKAIRNSRDNVTVGNFLRNLRWERPDDIEHYREGLVRAGLQE